MHKIKRRKLMKNYNSPIIALVALETADIITESLGDVEGTQGIEPKNP